MREYVVIYGQTRTGWSAHVPDLPGVIATGSNLGEVEQLMREGIVLHLTAMLEDGDLIPDATTRTGTITTDLVQTFRAKLARSA